MKNKNVKNIESEYDELYECVSPFKNKLEQEKWEIYSRDKIKENKELIGIRLYDNTGIIDGFPSSIIDSICMHDIGVYRNQYNNGIGYYQNFYCNDFILFLKQKELDDDTIDTITTLPDIMGIELLFKDKPDEFYFLPSEYENGEHSLNLVARDKKDFNGIYSNNLYQMVESNSSDLNLIRISVRKFNVKRNRELRNKH